jgi:hypothetical protein
MSRFLAWLLVVLLFGLFAGVALLLLNQRTEAGLDMPAFSVYSERGDGLAEAAHLLRQLGWTPVAVTRPIQHTHHRGLLIVAEPALSGFFPEQDGGITPQEAAALLHWVEQGNSLLLACRHSTSLHRALHVSVLEDRARSAEVFTRTELAEAGAYTQGIQHLSVATPSTLRSRDGLPLWWIHDQPGAVLLRRGEGRVLVLADPSPLTRLGLVRSDGVPRDDNALLLANVAALDSTGGEVFFDEYHHGLRAPSGFWTYISYYREHLFFVPLLVLLGAATWAGAVRLGPARAEPRPPRADAVAYASALARLYQRAGANRLLARTLVRGFLDGLTRHLSLPRQTLPALLLAAWRRQHPGAASATQLEALLRTLAELRKGTVPTRRLLEAAQAFDRFIADNEMAPLAPRRKVHAS